MEIIALNESALRQFIDSRTVFEELERVRKEAKEVRGGMKWKASGGKDYLVRVSASGGEKGLGARSAETEAIFAKFTQRRSQIEQRRSDLEEEMAICQRRNQVEGSGRAPEMLVKLLSRLDQAGIAEHFIVVGTHALYAYEQAAGLRIRDPGALATKDVDLLRDTRKRIQLATQMKLLSSSMIGLLRDVDPSFRLSEHDRYKAINSKGFEIDIIRREARHGDTHPLKLSDHEEEFWVVQARRANDLLSGERFSCVIASTKGSMARITTISPSVFVEFKRWMADQPSREPEKRSRDRLQADIVEELAMNYLTPKRKRSVL
jgi:hypothetical protein